MYDEETKRSTMMEGDGQASRVDLKGVLQDVTTTSNVEEDTRVEIRVVANSIVRVYHNERQKERHAIWSLRDLEVSMHLKEL